MWGNRAQSVSEPQPPGVTPESGEWAKAIHKSKGPTEVRPDLSLRRIAIFCTQRPSEEGLKPDALWQSG